MKIPRAIVMVGALAGLAGCPGDEGGTTGGVTSEASSSTTSEASSTTSGEATTGSTATSGSSGTTGGSSGTTGEATTAGTTGGKVHPPECACILDDPDEGHWGQQGSLPICGEPLCSVVEAEGWSDFFVLMNPDALTCVLTALRDRTPGVVRWSWSTNGGQFSDDGYILIQEGGIAIKRSWGNQDLSYNMSDARRGELPASDTFDACLAAIDASERFECLMGLQLIGPLIFCDEGWNEPYQGP